MFRPQIILCRSKLWEESTVEQVPPPLQIEKIDYYHSLECIFSDDCFVGTEESVFILFSGKTSVVLWETLKNEVNF